MKDRDRERQMFRLRVSATVGLLLATTGLLGRVAVGRPPSSSPLGAGPDRLVSMLLPHSRLLVQNLEVDQPMSGEVVLRRPDGSEAVRLPFADIPPLAPFELELASVPDLPVGWYSADISGTGRLTALARHAWPVTEPEGAQDLALVGAPEPGLELVLPFLAFSATQESALVVVHNVDPVSSTEVALEAKSFGADEPAWSKSLALAPGASALVDLLAPGVDGPAGSFEGHARLRAETAIAAVGFLVADPHVDPAVAALKAVPGEAAGPRLLTWFWTGLVGAPPSEIALVNPGPSTVQITPTFHVEFDYEGSCPQTPVVGPQIALEPGRGTLYVCDPELVPGLGAGCTGVLGLDASDGALIGAHVTLLPGHVLREPLAQAASLAGRPSTMLALPHIEWRASDRGATAVWTSVFALNPGSVDTSAELRALDPGGRTAHLPDYPVTDVPAMGSGLWDLGFVSGSSGDRRFAGAGSIDAGEPLFALVAERPYGDPGLYGGYPREAAHSQAAVPFLSRPPRWPTEPPYATRTPGPSPTPTITPTPVTVVPPLPGPEATLPAPPRTFSFEPALEFDGGACCTGLAWTEDGGFLAIDEYDAVGWNVTRYDDAGRRLSELPVVGRPERVTLAWDGTIVVLHHSWGPRISRFLPDGAPAGDLYLPRDRGLEIRDVAAAPDGTLWLVDNRYLETHHVDPFGDHLGSWRFWEALRLPGDGGYRVAVSPAGNSVYVLSWTRVLRFTPDGRLVTAWGAAGVDPGPFNAPLDLKIDSRGRVYMLEGTGLLKVYEPDGGPIAKWQTFDEPPERATWMGALAISFDDRIAVADSGARAVHVYEPLLAGREGLLTKVYLPSATVAVTR